MNKDDEISFWSRVRGLLIIFAFLAIFLTTPLINLYEFGEKYLSLEPIDCTTETIVHTEERRESAEITKGTEFVQSDGHDGERKMCKNRLGTQIVNEVVSEPVNRVVYDGTKEPVATSSYDGYARYLEQQQPQEVAEYEPTAQCNDGTPSYSANRRGTCSHHGGVAVWY